MRTKFALFGILILSAVCLQATPIRATVKNIDTTSRQFTLESIHSDENPELTGSMTVNVGVGDAEVPYLGKQIEGDLIKSDGKDFLQTIRPILPEKQVEMDLINLKLHFETAERQRREFRKLGDPGINFAMFNEHADAVQWDQYKGKWIIMNFFFTRCRMPKMCPAQTARMIQLQRHAQEAGIHNLQQLSVSFDPGYDTPGILWDYATSRGADLSTYSFLTGSKEVMMDVLKQYGVIAFDSKNIIDHTVTTLLFNKAGIIVLRRDGTEWDEGDFVQYILDEEQKESASLPE